MYTNAHTHRYLYTEHYVYTHRYFFCFRQFIRVTCVDISIFTQKNHTFYQAPFLMLSCFLYTKKPLVPRQACRPLPEVKAQCYHTETRTRTVTNRDGTTRTAPWFWHFCWEVSGEREVGILFAGHRENGGGSLIINPVDTIVISGAPTPYIPLPSRKEIHLPTSDFQVFLLLVSGRVFRVFIGYFSF